MQFISDGTPFGFSPCVATIGCFDGVHRGHRFLVDQVCRVARNDSLQSMLITFPVHPRQVMQSDYRPQLLSCLSQKLALMGRLQVDWCVLLPFTHELSLLTARDFMQMLHERYRVQVLVIGYDHRFGHNRAEGFDDYLRYGDELGIKVHRAEALVEEGFSISSSFIRSLLKEGKVEQANRCLGYRYYLDGTVVDGYKVGRTLGFPTANLRPSCPDKLLPHEGVYAVYAYVDGHRYKGMLNIGHRPTVANGDDLSIEVHLLGFSGDVYRHSLHVEFVRFIRYEQKFGDRDALIARLHEDKEAVLSLLP